MSEGGEARNHEARQCEHCGRTGAGYEVCDCGYRMVPRSPQGEAHEAGIEAAKQTDAARAIPDGEQGPWPGTKAFDAEVAAGVREIVAAYLSRCPSPVSGTEPDTAKLSAYESALRRIADQGPMKAPNDPWIHWSRIAREALAGFSVDAGKAGEDEPPYEVGKFPKEAGPDGR